LPSLHPPPGSNDFERHSTDVFKLSSTNVSPLAKILIGHDGTGIGAGWQLERVVVENIRAGECVTFEAHRCVRLQSGVQTTCVCAHACVCAFMWDEPVDRALVMEFICAGVHHVSGPHRCVRPGAALSVHARMRVCVCACGCACTHVLKGRLAVHAYRVCVCACM